MNYRSGHNSFFSKFEPYSEGLEGLTERGYRGLQRVFLRAEGMTRKSAIDQLIPNQLEFQVSLRS